MSKEDDDDENVVERCRPPERGPGRFTVPIGSLPWSLVVVPEKEAARTRATAVTY
jgi:hypothetical protein